jgi:hypothetical protein
MKLTTRLMFLSSTITLLTTGCASIMSGPNQNVSVQTEPEGAKATFINKKGIAVSAQQTPCIVSLKRRETYTLKIEKDDYQPLEAKLNKGLNGWYLGNVLFGGMLGILIVDPATGAMWSFHEPVNAQLALVSSGNLSRLTQPIHNTAPPHRY